MNLDDLTMELKYVAVGDSMSIDDYAGGEGMGAASLLYRNRDVDFPAWSGRDLATAGYAAQVLARDAATTLDVLHRQLPQLTARPDLVTITMGGNDLLACYGDDAAAEVAIAQVRTAGDQIVAHFRQLGGDQCRIVLSTVYDPSDGAGTVPASGLSAWPHGPIWVHALNITLTDLAARHGAALADLHGRFLGHGLLAGDPAQTNARPANRAIWYCGVVEPNAWGAHEIRSAWWEALGHFGSAACQ